MHEFFSRFIEVISDPINKKIKRSVNVGKIESDYIYMHNNVKVYKNSYYGNFSDILILNDGVHEPQEEYAFSVVLEKIKKTNPVMLELGCYWAFYSLSLLEKIPGSKCFLVEPGDSEIESGISNFSLNSRKGTFIKGTIGNTGITVDNFLIENSISTLDILHSDIQGYELEMLHGAKNHLVEKKIDYIFISTHSNDLHDQCINFLKEVDYHIISSVNLDETYCCDGIIVAQNKNLEILHLDLGRKDRQTLISDLELSKIFTSKGINL
jgi:hypothetical protein